MDRYSLSIQAWIFQKKEEYEFLPSYGLGRIYYKPSLSSFEFFNKIIIREFSVFRQMEDITEHGFRHAFSWERRSVWNSFSEEVGSLVLTLGTYRVKNTFIGDRDGILSFGLGRVSFKKQ